MSKLKFNMHWLSPAAAASASAKAGSEVPFAYLVRDWLPACAPVSSYTLRRMLRVLHSEITDSKSRSLCLLAEEMRLDVLLSFCAYSSGIVNEI